LLYRFFKYIELKLYKNADQIGIESRSDMNYFLQYVTKEKVEVLNNWGSPLDTKDIHVTTKTEFIDTEKVNILYGGNMGDAQDLLSLVKLVNTNILSDKAMITLIGAGNQTQDIKNYISSRNIKNILVLPEVDRDTYLDILLKADVGIVSLNRKLGSNNFPLKMMGYIQLSKPILASVNPSNEIIELIQNNNIGYVSIAGDKTAFNNNLELMINDHELRVSQGKNALALFNKSFTVEAATEQILTSLNNI
jgi:glycosyltransferase involved in cell wall biosynthesis